MYKFADIVIQRRRFIIECAIIMTALLLISLLSPPLQARHATLLSQLRAANSNQIVVGSYDSPNVMTNMFSRMTDNAQQASGSFGLKTLSVTVGAAASVAHFDSDIVHGGQTAVVFTSHIIGKVTSDTVHGIGHGFAYAGHTTGHLIGNVFGFVSGITHVSAIIRPQDNTPTPVITQLRIQQAALIQSNTTQVSIATLTSGAGGLCDSGSGNGGYPTAWCNTSMDSAQTISYSGDHINRECTSYAYWYFTSVEGHSDFRVSGNAKYWAGTTNYPIHSSPAFGAIAVETAGAYGHVAIVQALPGQTYAGQVVPTGYVLVSEMNYDWNGHFRYSYSPLGKFSSYIYP